MKVIILLFIYSFFAIAQDASVESQLKKIKDEEQRLLDEDVENTRRIYSQQREDTQNEFDAEQARKKEKHANDVSDGNPDAFEAADLANSFLTSILPEATDPVDCWSDEENPFLTNEQPSDEGLYSPSFDFKDLVTREQSGLPLSKAQKDSKKKSKITIHHSEGNKSQSVNDIHKFHTGSERGWADIAYHFIISKSGGTWKVYEGRPLDRLGSHAKGNNAGNIGIMIAGNYNSKASASNPRSSSSVEPEAISLLEGLVSKLVKSHQIQGIHAHGQKHAGSMGLLKGYDCPGAGLVDTVARLRKQNGL